MRQGQAFVLSALFLFGVVAVSGALQSSPKDVGGSSKGTDMAPPPPPPPPPDQGNPGDVGGPPGPADTGGTSTSGGGGGFGGSGMGTAPGKHAKHAAHCTYKGTVASVDATAKSFVVRPAKGDDVTLRVNDKTRYSPKGKTWDDVKADAKVSGTCKKDGADSWAVTVKFWPEKASKTTDAKTGAK